MHEREVVFKNGLVDPTTLLEYMDGCHCGQLHPPANNHQEEYHHLYFPRKKYRNVRPQLEVRRLRNSKYNLIEMLSCQEDFYHQSTEMDVPQDKISLEIAQVYLEEDGILTDYAASSWLLAKTAAILESPGVLPRSERARQAARLAIINEMNTEDAKRVSQIEIMEPSIVIGALSKYLLQQPEVGLRSVVDARMEEATSVIPTKIYDDEALKNNAETRIWRRVSVGSWTTKKLFTAEPSAKVA